MKIDKLLQAAIITFAISVFTGIKWSSPSQITDKIDLNDQIVLNLDKIQK